MQNKKIFDEKIVREKVIKIKSNPVFNSKRASKVSKISFSDDKKLTPLGMASLISKYLFLIVLVLITLYPITYIVVSSLNGSLPRNSLQTTKDFDFTLEFFKNLNDTKFWTWMTNSMVIGFVCMIIVVVFSGFMAFGFSRYSFTGKKTWMIFIILIGLIPNLMALIIFYIISDILAEFGLPSSIVLILLYSGGGIVGNMYILKSYMDGISRELDDSARIDGLSNWKLFTKIVGPLAKPMLSIVAFWSFLAPFGDVILSGLILSSNPDSYTIPLGLMSLISGDPTTISYPMFAAGSVVVALPIVIIFLILQKNISSGLAAGAVKG